MKEVDRLERVDCEACGWEGTIDEMELARFRMPVCPSCWSDEINYADSEGKD